MTQPSTKPDFDTTRATAIINVAMQHNMFPQGAMPESDADKIMQAEQLYQLALQANEVAQALGKQNVPSYPAIEAILFEAQVLVGANGNGSGTEAPSPTPSSSSDSSPLVSVPSPPAPGQQTPPSPPTTDELSPGASSPPQDSSPSAPSSEGLIPEPKANERWVDAGGGVWDVVIDRGAQLEVRSVTTGERTVVPTGFLKTKTDGPISHIDVEARPMDNALIYTHPGCGKWIVPLDDVILPKPGDERECDECSMVFPILNVEPNGYVSPHESASPPGTPPAERVPGTTDSFLGSTPNPQAEPETLSANAHVASQEAAPAGDERGDAPAENHGAHEAGARTSNEARDDEGDDEYAKVIARVEANFSPGHMPAPQDLERPPEGMPEDLTADETANRSLHSQFNALAARARFLYAIENALARDCERVRKGHMRGSMKVVRQQLGKDATVTEVKDEAEQDENVVLWAGRRDRHADRADAYKTFMEIYAENVKVLSRDLTWAGAEERGS